MAIYQEVLTGNYVVAAINQDPGYAYSYESNGSITTTQARIWKSGGVSVTNNSNYRAWIIY